MLQLKVITLSNINNGDKKSMPMPIHQVSNGLIFRTFTSSTSLFVSPMRHPVLKRFLTQ